MKPFVHATIAIAGLWAGAAAAEPIRIAQALLADHDIVAIVRSAGFTPISPALRRGDTYVLRAAGRDGRELRVVVGARSGEIRAAMPVVPAAMPGGPRGPYERLGPSEPDGYIGPPGEAGVEPPIVHQGDRPMRRPAQPVPRGGGATAPEPGDFGEQQAILTPERGGMLPPPPERFPPRALPAEKPAAKPAPAKRAAAPPLPKPQPTDASAVADPAPPAAAAPAPPVESKPDPRAVPH